MEAALTASITNGRLDFGTWQQIFYAEFDGQRDKRVLVWKLITVYILEVPNNEKNSKSRKPNNLLGIKIWFDRLSHGCPS
ncbi:MAG: YjbQ family protein [Bdellovibrionaceae bacterium]|nr:YjbQ family protein [Pseudobdellovibrionaceae bacterium]